MLRSLVGSEMCIRDRYHFTSWLEEDIPDSSVDILKIHSLINEYDPLVTVKTPLLVHGRYDTLTIKYIQLTSFIKSVKKYESFRLFHNFHIFI